MKKFVVERNLPGAGNLSREELQAMSQRCCEVMKELGTSYHWIQSFVTDDKIYCIHIAESETVIREHAVLGKLPVNMINEINFTIDPLNSNPI